MTLATPDDLHARVQAALGEAAILRNLPPTGGVMITGYLGELADAAMTVLAEVQARAHAAEKALADRTPRRWWLR
jgi:hypothetical protein